MRLEQYKLGNNSTHSSGGIRSPSGPPNLAGTLWRLSTPAFLETLVLHKARPCGSVAPQA